MRCLQAALQGKRGAWMSDVIRRRADGSWGQGDDEMRRGEEAEEERLYWQAMEREAYARWLQEQEVG